MVEILISLVQTTLKILMVYGMWGFIGSPLRLTGHVNRAYYEEIGVMELFRR